ncbi:hypothetical protein D0860_01810 [Hortaea werneckii]|uniref:UFSP1/2/DUB catalytic domain-containing protein n=1 Tax=Hortaea werneckii TaxID=91943 RepID=A0A3M7HPL0_HORWE|nr:hypothetical protein D0860_01810 [Hortaea werneckii]
MAEIACPFCNVISETAVIQAHIEEEHAENGGVRNITEDDEAKRTSQLNASTKAARDASESMPDDEFIKCTRPGCGEYIRMEEIDEHLEVHAAISASEDGIYDAPTHRRSTKSTQSDDSADEAVKRSRKARKHKPVPKSSTHTLLEYFSGQSVHGGRTKRPPAPPLRHELRPPKHIGRLGKRELGPYAFEDSMPSSVRRRLINDALPHPVNTLSKSGRLLQDFSIENETPDVIPILADLCASDPINHVAYFCSPTVRHVRKIYCEGNFCGYWSMQMVLSYLQASGALASGSGSGKGARTGTTRLPNVLEMQETIEQAWANGIASHGRIETGGVKGTRKWIGTSEAVAFFRQLGIPIEALSFKDDEDELAVTELLDYVEAYFLGGIHGAQERGCSRLTQLSPIYFQRRGHSTVIVGLEREKDGARNLLVFDSSFETSRAIRAKLAGKKSQTAVDTILRAYRRSDQSLARYKEFEIMVPRAEEG